MVSNESNASQFSNHVGIKKKEGVSQVKRWRKNIKETKALASIVQ
jgi:hypothetical protein